MSILFVDAFIVLVTRLREEITAMYRLEVRISLRSQVLYAGH